MNKLLTVDEGVEALHQQKIILYPTEGVYGIGADARNSELARKICQLKGRPLSKGLIVLVDSVDRLNDWILPLSEAQRKQMEVMDQGFHHTWLVPKTDKCPLALSGDFPDLAVRITTHLVAQALCQKFGAPIISTSANIQGEPAIITRKNALKLFATEVAGVVSGELGGLSQATKIQHIVSGEVFRI